MGTAYISDIASLNEAVKDCGIDKIVVEPKEYSVSAPVRISGRTTPLEITSDGAVLTCRVPLTLRWEKYSESIYVSDCCLTDPPDALFADGEKLIMARYPNFREGELFGGFSADSLSEERISKWKNPKYGHIMALHFSEWGSNDYVIEGKNKDGSLITKWVGDNNRGSGIHAVKRMVENIFEELDAPEEWFYDRDEKKLYYYPPDGKIPGVMRFEAVCGHGVFDISSSKNIKIGGFTFENTARTLFSGEYDRPLRGDWGIVRDAVIRVENCENTDIADCCFKDIGGNAIIFNARNDNCSVKRCRFNGIGATGVLITGLVSCVREPSFWDNDMHRTEITDFTPGPEADDYPRNIRVSECNFYDIGTVEKQTAAVCMSVSSHITVSHCTVSRCSRAGINICDGTFGGHIIEDNDLFDCVTETADHGPINCWGRDRFWSLGGYTAMGLAGETKRPFALLDAVDKNIIRHNRVSANYAFGIDIDDGASNFEIYDNLCIGVGIKVRDGFDRRVYNNILIGTGFERHMNFAYCGDLIYSNIVVADKAYNEICINENANTYIGYNLYWNYGDGISCLHEDEPGAVIADPMFADFEGNDFSVGNEDAIKAIGFRKFDVSEDAFGAPSGKKPKKYVRIVSGSPAKCVRYYDLVLSDIDGDGMRSAAGLPDYEGAFVVSRDVLGLFCKMGIAIGTGDVIRTVNGKKLIGAEDFITGFESISPGSCAEIGIYRNQKPMKLTFIRPEGRYISIVDDAIDEWNRTKIKKKG